MFRFFLPLAFATFATAVHGDSLWYNKPASDWLQTLPIDKGTIRLNGKIQTLSVAPKGEQTITP